jgi:hypothetical protein
MFQLLQHFPRGCKLLPLFFDHALGRLPNKPGIIQLAFRACDLTFDACDLLPYPFQLIPDIDKLFDE